MDCAGVLVQLTSLVVTRVVTVSAGGHRAHVCTARRGRGSQMVAGARVAHGKVLWFLHADTHPPADAVQQILRACDNPEIVGGNFTVKFDGQTYAARFLSRLYR